MSGIKEKCGIRGFIRLEHRSSDGTLKGEYFVENALGNNGIADMAGLVGNTGSVTAYSYLAIGTGSPAANALGTEITTGGGGRAAATVSRVTTTVTNDTLRFVHTWTFSSSFTVTECGVFNNATAGMGNKLGAQSFTGIPVVSSDTLKATYDFAFGA